MSDIRLIGKESNAIEETEAGLIGDWDTMLSTYGNRSTKKQRLGRLRASAKAYDVNAIP